MTLHYQSTQALKRRHSLPVSLPIHTSSHNILALPRVWDLRRTVCYSVLKCGSAGMADKSLFILDAEARWRLAYDSNQWIIQRRKGSAR